MTASRLRAAALYEPLTQHSSVDILFYETGSFIYFQLLTCTRNIYLHGLFRAAGTSAWELLPQAAKCIFSDLNK